MYWISKSSVFSSFFILCICLSISFFNCISLVEISGFLFFPFFDFWLIFKNLLNFSCQTNANKLQNSRQNHANKSCSNHVKIISKSCQDRVKIIPKPCQSHAKIMPKSCQHNVQNYVKKPRSRIQDQNQAIEVTDAN